MRRPAVFSASQEARPRLSPSSHSELDQSWTRALESDPTKVGILPGLLRMQAVKQYCQATLGFCLGVLGALHAEQAWLEQFVRSGCPGRKEAWVLDLSLLPPQFDAKDTPIIKIDNA